MRFLVRPGQKVATDGVIEQRQLGPGQEPADRRARPGRGGPGDEVVGATVNAGGRLVVRATRVGSDTALGQIARLVSDAQAGKAPVQRLADRVSAVFVPVVFVLAAATLGFWLGTGESTAFAFTTAVAVLIIACPCALGLATPTALMVGSGRGAQLGLLIKGPEVLESTRRVDTVLLDKTGTVTTGRMALADVVTADGTTREQALRLVGAVEDASEHPVARAIAGAARAEADGPLPVAGDFAARPGLGAQGVVDGTVVVAGRPALLAEHGLLVPPGALRGQDRGRGGGPHRRAGRLARQRARRAGGCRHRQAQLGRGRGPPARAGAAPGAADRRQPRHGRGGGCGRWASRTSWPRCCRATRRPRSATCRRPAGSWPWSATA